MITDPEPPPHTNWGQSSSYDIAWNPRAIEASKLIPAGISVFEIGVGLGFLKSLIEKTNRYKGADLDPLEASIIKLDLENDPLPIEKFDLYVALGVLEYIKNIDNVIQKLTDSRTDLLTSYCCFKGSSLNNKSIKARRSKGWVNDFTKNEFIDLYSSRGYRLDRTIELNQTNGFQQFIFLFIAHSEHSG